MAMKTSNDRFSDRVTKELDNPFMRSAVSNAQDRFQTRRLQQTLELGDWEEWRSHGEEIRKHVLENLDYYLHQLSENLPKEVAMFSLLKLLKKRQPIFKVLRKRKMPLKLLSQNRW